MKTALITGTSKGIGLETALAFGRAGYKVFATMRNPEKANAFKEKIASESLAIHISAMDVDSDESVKRGIDAILDEVGTIDVLINWHNRCTYQQCGH
jgi:NAD(P)-dependent dehydrogenase (short-subunit alcohol dehydrogenase family)